MPVRELTDRPTIPRLGKIRLGDQGGRNGAPRNMPHFVVPPEVAEVYGPEPTELKVVFLSDDLELIASQYYRAYNATSGLICKGDGFSADALLDGDELRKNGGELSINAWAHGDTRGAESKATKNFVRQQITCAGGGYEGLAPCPMFAAKKCAVRNFLQFAIKDVPGLGVYQLDTGSLISTRQINGAIEMARLMFGGIRGVPCTLRRVKRDVAPDGVKKSVWMVELEVDTTYSLTTLLELRSGPISRALLPPVDESEVYGEIEEEIDEGEPQEQEEPASGAPLPTPTEAPAAPAPVAPVDLLNEISKKHGAPAASSARAVLPILFGTMDLLKLNQDQCADYIEILRVRLNNPNHEHEMAYTADARPICRLCGEAMKEEEPAAQGSLV